MKDKPCTESAGESSSIRFQGWDDEAIFGLILAESGLTSRNERERGRDIQWKNQNKNLY